MNFENPSKDNNVSNISEGHKIRIQKKLEELQKYNFPEIKEAVLITEKILGGEIVSGESEEYILRSLKSKMLMAQNLEDRGMYSKAIAVIEDAQIYARGSVVSNKERVVIQGSKKAESEVVAVGDFQTGRFAKEVKGEITESEVKDLSRELVSTLQQAESFQLDLEKRAKNLLDSLERLLLEKSRNTASATIEQSRDTYDLLGAHEELEVALRQYQRRFREV